MIALTYRIYLDEPLLVTSLDGDPNSAVSYPFIPGSVLRGALISRFGIEDAADPATRRLFFSGATRFLNGYPVIAHEHRSLPCPLTWRRQKGMGPEDEITDFAYDGNPSPEETWEGVEESFCLLTHGTATFLEQERRLLSVHNARDVDRGLGRPRRGFGSVFRYEALAAGQSFQAIILCDQAEDADTLAARLDGPVLLGGSRSAGYGAARMELLARDQGWREVPSAEEVNDPLVVTLLSDALLRDSEGQWVASDTAVRTALEGLLGVPLADWPVDGQPWHVFRARPVGGFNRKWGLPLPQTLAVEMGSVFVFRRPPDLKPETLAALEWRGIGARRAEGFGRLAVDWHGCYPQLNLGGKLEGTPEGKPEPRIVKVMFGTHTRASKLRVRESVVEGVRTDLVQNRVSIDRFTGGARDTALFNEQPLFETAESRLTLHLRLDNPTEAEMGLMMLLLKDLWTGHLPLGGGISVGRGRLRGRSAAVRWQANGAAETWTLSCGANGLHIPEAMRQAGERWVRALSAQVALENEDG